MSRRALLLVPGVGADANRLCASVTGTFDHVTIFPLTSEYLEVNQLRDLLLVAGHSTVEVLDSARRVDGEVSFLRKHLGSWYGVLAKTLVDEFPLKDHLRIPGLPLSAWWLSLAAERSPLKSPVFLSFAQLRAIRSVMAERKFDLCVTTVNDRPMADAMGMACREVGTTIHYLASDQRHPLNDQVKRWLRNCGGLGQLVTGGLAWLRLCYKIWFARRVMGPPPQLPELDRQLLFVTYFPAFDKEAAARGQFHNKYAKPLQDLLSRLNRPVVWLLVYTTLYQTSYRQAVIQASRFVEAGEPMVMLEQYGSTIDCLRILRQYVALAWGASRLYHQVAPAALAHGPLPACAEPLWRHLWKSSFLGNEAVNVLFFAFAFHRAVNHLGHRTEDCLYYWEMQAWEKALCAAWRDSGRGRTIAFQHASLPSNLWPCFPDPAETARTESISDLPLPDILVASGPIPYAMLRRSSFPYLTQAESIRYTYLNGTRRTTQTSKGKVPSMLVAGSIDQQESLALLHLVVAMPSLPPGFRILLKGHPSMPFAPLLEQIGLQNLPSGFEIWDSDLDGALNAAWIVLVSASTVALEALALGCKIIAPLLPDAIQLNPIADIEGWCSVVSSPTELRKVIEVITSEGPPVEDGQAWDFVQQYWNLDPQLPSWNRLLTARQPIEYGSSLIQPLTKS